MKKKQKGKKALARVLIALCILVFFGYVACKYFGILIPELPDNHHYENLEQRAEKAIKVAKRHNLNEDYCLL